MTDPLHYRYRPGIGLEAKYADAFDLEHNWRVTLVPTVQEALRVPGEIERMVEARDRAIDERFKAMTENGE